MDQSSNDGLIRHALADRLRFQDQNVAYGQPQINGLCLETVFGGLMQFPVNGIIQGYQHSFDRGRHILRVESKVGDNRG